MLPTDGIHASEENDMLFDYLLDSETNQEYKDILSQYPEIDSNPDNWERFTTCYGNFINFKHKITGEVL